VTNLHRHRRARTRDLLHRRVRALTAVVGLTSLTGAGALTIELAEPSAAAVAPKTTPSQAPATQAPAPAATEHPRVRHHTVRQTSHPAPAPATASTSTSTSGGS
jgi:hypothetical protein